MPPPKLPLSKFTLEKSLISTISVIAEFLLLIKMQTVRRFGAISFGVLAQFLNKFPLHCQLLLGIRYLTRMIEDLRMCKSF